MKKFLFVAVPVLAVLILSGFAVQKAEACHAEGGANCDGWWVNIVGPGDGWVLDHITGDTSGTWQPGQTHVDYDVTAYYKKWVVSGYWSYVNRPTTPPVYDCALTENIHGTSYNVSDFYNKPTGDDNHCHRINWDDLSSGEKDDFKAMHHNDRTYGSPNHGTWESAYNSHIDQNPLAHLVTPGGYGSCPAGYDVVPGNPAKCRKWMDTSHWIYQSYHFTGKINRPDCYETCSETVDGTPSEWSEWELVNGVYTRTRTVPLLDSQDPSVVCGSRTETQTQELCDETVAVTLPDTYSEWSPWVYDSEDGLEHSFRTVTHHSYLGDAIDPDHVCTPPADPETEERTREVEYSLSVIGDGTCSKWEYVPSYSEGATLEVEGELEGVWSDPYTPETAPVPTVKATWPSGYSLTVTPDAIVEEGSCVECKYTPLYPQAAYFDPNAPGSYWQGPFGMGPGVSVIIHPDGQTPSADRVTVLSSLCPEVFPGGYIYRGENKFLDGWVYKVECYGQETHYEYFGYNWDKWVRLGMYDNEGNRTCAREEGCADWIKENAGILP
jgi:hypothetical protein